MITVNNLQKPFNYIITAKAKFKMDTYFDLAGRDEVGGILRIKELENNTKLIIDVMLLKQTVSSGEFETDQDTLTKLTKDLFKTNRKKLEEIKGWWHKHPITGWSMQDDSCFERLAKTFGGLCSGVVLQSNKELLWRTDMISDTADDSVFLTHGTHNFNIKETVFDVEKVKNNCEKLFKKNVKKAPPIVYKPKGGQHWKHDQNGWYKTDPWDEWENDDFAPKPKEMSSAKTSKEKMKLALDCSFDRACSECAFLKGCVKDLIVEGGGK